MDRRATYPGERMIILAEQRREWRAGLSALAVVFGATIGSWLVLSSPQDPSLLGVSVVPRAEAAAYFAEQPSRLHGMNPAGPIQEAQADAPLTHDDIIKVQERLKALGYDPGNADGRPGKRTIEALNAYRDTLGLQPVEVLDRQAVAPLTP
ncbi:peptidoglycan-binding protein [Dongia sp.]|uniref:peptidoglycan-binding domain-containing protein n=1 Tax=Dongia sp. TaxID=1977262 RepID=UPI0037510FDF